MSNPKKKAQELVKKMYGNIFDGGQYEDAQEGWYKANQCALIAVQEILLIYKNGGANHLQNIYWQEVKEEIIKL